MIYHADWGTDPKKRWIAKAKLRDESYIALPPDLVGDHKQLLRWVRDERGDGCALFGFDFPIGIPAQYARRIGATQFKSFLLGLGVGRWSNFFDVCKEPTEICPSRPFYPYQPGGTKQSHLLAGFGIGSMDDLRRKCERAYDGRRAASSLFWTLGANQVGKAAICGWRDVLIPALKGDSPPQLWPFDGPLDYLLQSGNLVIAETYPAEYYGWLFKAPLKGKGKLAVRQQVAPELLGWADAAGVRLDPDLEKMILDGFPNDDAFDAAVGLFGMLEVVLGRRLGGETDDSSINSVEGWILGQTM